MRVVAMISGGKDSCYNMMQCVAEGHEIVAIANLHPKDKDELDSYMYQTVGHMGIEILAKAMDLPLYRMETKGTCLQSGSIYSPTDDDEVEDLLNLLKWTKEELNVEAVAVGAILSDYQRVRVENVCGRLKLVPLAYLWRRDQTELLQEMIDCNIHAIIIKVAALGLVPERHLGKSLKEMQPYLIKMHEKYGLNVCGEGGEYETFTTDCPLFKQRISIDGIQTIISSADNVCSVGYINFTRLSLKPKDVSKSYVYVKKSLDYIADLNESSYNDLSDPDLSETELEKIEKETRLRESCSQSDLILARSESFKRKIVTSPIPKIIKSSSVEDTKASSSFFIRTTSNNEIPEPFIFENENRKIYNTPMSVNNSKGWLWITGVQGCGDNFEIGMNLALNKLKEIIVDNCYKLQEICYITLYVNKISTYAGVNEIYASIINFQNPPTRVCVECPLPENCHVVLEATAFKSSENINNSNRKRHTMHVQGISHWAPANIGPYSQSTRIGNITYISGQIALIPGSMTIIDGGIRYQCKLALRHISRIAKAMNAQGQLKDVVQGICFITHPSYINEARRQWERCTTNAIMDYIVVPGLPQNALVEWQVWAHTHNDQFEYEETGCSINEYSISIRRRWDYENNCAAVICYASTGSATSSIQITQIADDILDNHYQRAQKITVNDLIDILTYIFRKLLKDCKTTKQFTEIMKDCSTSNIKIITKPAIHLKVFYQLTAKIPIDNLFMALKNFKIKMNESANIAYTVLPACSLHNFSTFLSFCAIRHE